MLLREIAKILRYHKKNTNKNNETILKENILFIFVAIMTIVFIVILTTFLL